ncbi:dnaj-like sec63 [Stylonychia lemnae]|uniref:Dnaj-like sec63 n=1 Tax=Stylonychia lemnae TaxID=5949 RepID=A0A078ATI9_STYLE|nr:dnaj-like sec63 [Stylonychia lemnae]|eukprot:CDW85549.1 dnaj-like sec63 [Stylonychia lemnae]
MITAQFFIILYLIISLTRVLLCSKGDKKSGRTSLIVKGVLLMLFTYWFYLVLNLIQTDQESSLSKDFDPYEILEVPVGAFNTPEIKKSYRNKAIKYHPDKHVGSPDIDTLKQKFAELVKAYEILTDKKKYDNWQKYGNPDGSVAYKAVEIALPSFLLKPENSGTILVVFLLVFICLPIGSVIQQQKRFNIFQFFSMKRRERFHKNGLQNENRIRMLQKISEIVKSSGGRFNLTDDQILSVYEEIVEIQQINEKVKLFLLKQDQLGKKSTARDLIQSKINGKKVSDEFLQFQDEILNILYDDHTAMILLKGRIHLETKNITLSFNIQEIYQSFGRITEKIFQEEAQILKDAYTIELKSYVEDLDPSEPILTGYILTQEIQVKQNIEISQENLQMLPNIFHTGILYDDTDQKPEQLFAVQLISEKMNNQKARSAKFPVIQKFQQLMRQIGAKKYSVVLFSSLGQMIKSNQTFVRVRKGEFVPQGEDVPQFNPPEE